MVERPILLHEDNDMLDVMDAARPVVRRYLERLCDAGIQGASHGTHAEQLQEFTPIGILHGNSVIRAAESGRSNR